MNKVLVAVSLFVIACSGNVSQREATHNGEGHNPTTAEAPIALQLNNGAKWKTDETTRKNVASMVKVINDGSNTGKKDKAQLMRQLQSRIDTLVQECKMKGPDHDALHVWLEQVLHDLKAVKEKDSQYAELYIVLKKDVESFYAYFE
jgi:hypothetical protein